MRILIDTHCWLWLHTEPERFSEPVLEVLTDPSHELYFSAASAWEIAIKYSIGKLPLPMAPAQYVSSRLTAVPMTELSIEHRHALAVAQIPRHHRDPFDRLLVAQAQLESLTLLTADAALHDYQVEILGP